jgi:gamma-glutamyltranspeptidase/glutathione hydrolase
VVILLLAALFPLTAPAWAEDAAPTAPVPVISRQDMVVSQERRATEIGRDILARGGNAVDAAAAVGFALAVTHPQAGNLGGGGFMLIRLADRNEAVAIDYREAAPQATTRDLLLDQDGNYSPDKARDSGLAVAVPGTVAGLARALAKYGSGRFTLADVIAPAIALARDGIPVDEDLAASLARAKPRLGRWSSSASIFLKPDGAPLAPGDRLVQSDLAETLAAIARDGPRAFYAGPTADRIATAVQRAGGILTSEDLKAYQVFERPPVTGTYRGYDVVSMPPPSSGGVHLIEMLNILEPYRLEELGAGSPKTLHLMIEAMKRAYADRARFLGDPDQVEVPVAHLLSKDYAARLRITIDPAHATPASALGAGEGAHEGANTTHFSVIDRFGNAVANTYTINFNYGVGLVADGTGVLLNNEMDDFAAKPGVPNAFGLTGGAANAPAPGKRPLSSMTPTILTKDGRTVLITGSPGGSRIITTVLQVILNTIDFHENIAAAVAAPRTHDQWLPDEVFAEAAVPRETVEALASLGHKVVVGGSWGSANSILVGPDGLEGAADPRSHGAAAAGN